MSNKLTTLCVLLALLHSGAVSKAQNPLAKTRYDLVILNGRVMDPESGLEAIRNVGVKAGTIQSVTTEPLEGRVTVDARGLVVAPGFIDLHQHGQDNENYRLKAMDGVTTALELEIGTADVDRWYAERLGKPLINYGVSIGHPPTRMVIMHDPGDFLPTGDAAHKSATEAEIEEMKLRIDHGLKRGALAVGFGVAYTEAASSWEILEMFRVASRYGASCHVHLRHGRDAEDGLEEVLAAAAVSGAPLHVVHIQSTGGAATLRELEMIREARDRGLDVTTEMYPYTAGMTRIDSALFDGWEKYPDAKFQTYLWPATGERLTRETFAKYRTAGGFVIMFSNTQETVDQAARNPLTMIASDGLIHEGKGHPRTSGTYSRILGHHVREMHDLSLMDALRKMTLMPAQRLEKRAPMMKNKGRIRVGADADITIFDAERIIDKATYEAPAKYSEGIQFVIVNGTVVVNDGQLQSAVAPGQAVRAPVQ
jgi:N-acyl-D-aspartate/D-glutamate deacylase